MIKKFNNLFYLIITVKNFWTVLSLYLGVKPQKKFIILTLYSKKKIIIRPLTTDFHEVISVLSGKEYPLKLINLKNNSKTIVIDLGSHIGTFTTLVKTKFPEISVYAVEPNTDNFDIFQKNIKLNNFNNVNAFNYAMSDKNGYCDLLLNKSKPNESKTSSNNINNKETFKTKMVSFKDFVKINKIKKINLLKIDCEGCEYQLIKDFPSNIDEIVMEYHILDNNNPSTLLSFFKNREYKLVYSSENLDLNSGIYWFKKNGRS